MGITCGDVKNAPRVAARRPQRITTFRAHARVAPHPRRLVGTALAGGAATTLPAEARRGRGAEPAVWTWPWWARASPGSPRRGRSCAPATPSSCWRPATASGGRAHNLVLPGGEVAERGATFAGPTQDHILALAKEVGVETFPTYDTGDNVYLNQGQRQTYPSNGPTGTAPLDPLVLPEMVAAITLLDQMSTTVPVDSPWTAPNAVEWDGQTLESWVKSRSATERFQRIVSVATRPVFGAEPRELSLLFVLFYIAASGNEQNPGTFERNFNTRGGAQMWRFRGGTQRIAQLMAKQLGPRVHRSTAVRRIDQTASGVRVEADKLTVRAKRAIVAIPPTLAARIDYHPALPAARDQLTQRLGQGTLTKVTVVYDTRSGAPRGCRAPRPARTASSPPRSTTRPRAASRASCSASSAATTHARTRACGQRRGAQRSWRSWRPCSALRRATRRATTSRAGPTSATRAAAPWPSPAPAHCWPTAPRCDRPSAGCTGRGRRRPRTGTAIWMALCAPASARPRRCWPPSSRSPGRGTDRRPEWKATNASADSGVMPVRCAT
jgi:monoamine oxidase